MPDSGDDLRSRIASALRDHEPPSHAASELPADEFDCCAAAVLAAVESEVEAIRVLHRKTLRAAFKESGEWKDRASNAESVLERVWAVVEEMPADSLAKELLVNTLEGKRR